MICEHCGEQKKPIEVEFNGKTYQVGWHDCGCEGARKERQIESARDAIAKEREFQRRLYEAGIPERYRSADKVVDVKRLNELNKTAEERGLYLHGGTGTGKTTMALAIAITAIREGRSAKFVKAYQIPALFRTYADAEETLARPYLLVIDDLGSDTTTEWANTRLRAAIDARYDSMRPTVVTSNYSKDQLAKLLLRNVKDMTPRAIISRLSEMTESVEMGGEDLRK